jgi:pentatricopeptide repeat protein
MHASGFDPSQVTYGILLDELGKAGDLDRAFSELEVLKSKGIKPNVVLMSSIINSCGKHGRLDRGFQLYKTMAESAEPRDWPNSVTCSSLIDASLKNNEIDKAFTVLREMRARDVPLTEVTYTSIISELTKLNGLGRLEEVPWLEGEPTPRGMRAAGVAVGVVTYNALISAFASNGDIKKAIDALLAMQADRIQPNIISYNMLIKACHASKDPTATSVAEEIFSQMQQRTNHFATYVEPNEMTFQRLMQMHCDTNANATRVFELKARMDEMGIEPSVYSLRACAMAASSLNNPTLGLKVLQEIRDLNSNTLGGGDGSKFDYKSWKAVLDCILRNIDYSVPIIPVPRGVPSEEATDKVSLLRVLRAEIDKHRPLRIKL